MPFSEPKILTIDYEDDPKIFGIPEDTPLEDKQMMAEDSKPFDRKVLLSCLVTSQ